MGDGSALGGGGGARPDIVRSGERRSSGSKNCRRASAGILFCVGDAHGGDGSEREQGELRLEELPHGGQRRDTGYARGKGRGRKLLWAGKGEFGLEELPRGERRDNVVRGCGEAAGYCSERENGEFGLEELPQGERRDIVLRGAGGRGKRHDIVLSGGEANSGSKNCRSASAGILLCVGKNRRGKRQDIVLSGREGSSGSKSCRRASAGRLFCAGRRGMGEVAGDWCERGNGDSGLKGLPQGEHRDIVVRGGREEGARQEIDLGGGSSEFGLEELPRASAGRQFCVGGGGRTGEVAGDCSGREQGGRARRAAAGRAPGYGSAWGRQDEEAAGDCSERGKGEFGLVELPQGERREIVLRGGSRNLR